MNKKLELSPEEMRELGYRVIDMIVNNFQTVRDKPVKAYKDDSREAMESRFADAIPQGEKSVSGLLDFLEKNVIEENYHRIHPRDFAYVNGPSNYVSFLADTLVVGYNVFAGAWVSSPSAAMIELITIDWLRQLMGMPDSVGGIFTSGGSVANLTGLAVARHIKLGDDMTDARVYLSNQTHASVAKALRMLGFHDEQIRRLPTDDNFRLDMIALKDAVTNDRAEGKRPFCVVANAGTTNTGTVDPLPEIAAFCKEENLWLHLDGAYGAAAMLSEKGREALKGLELADSLSIDPHKWLFQPYEMGCTLVRDKRHLWQTFNTTADYLKDLVDPTQQEVNFYEHGIQMTRSFRALKLWLSLKAFGIEAFQAAVSRGIELAEIAEKTLKQDSCWQILTPAQLGVITFRYVQSGLSEPEIDALNQKISQEIVEDGFAFVHTTWVNGKVALRLVTINPRTTDEDIVETIAKLKAYADG